jgi:hypothetical protein
MRLGILPVAKSYQTDVDEVAIDGAMAVDIDVRSVRSDDIEIRRGRRQSKALSETGFEAGYQPRSLAGFDLPLERLYIQSAPKKLQRLPQLLLVAGALGLQLGRHSLYLRHRLKQV